MKLTMSRLMPGQDGPRLRPPHHTRWQLVTNLNQPLAGGWGGTVRRGPATGDPARLSPVGVGRLDAPGTPGHRRQLRYIRRQTCGSRDERENPRISRSWDVFSNKWQVKQSTVHQYTTHQVFIINITIDHMCDTIQQEENNWSDKKLWLRICLTRCPRVCLDPVYPILSPPTTLPGHT